MSEPVYPYGYVKDANGVHGMGTLLTWDQMMTKSTVNKLNPEVRRRFHALILKGSKEGVPLGCGTGWRIQPVNRPGFASPGNSYHEGFPADGVSGGALAIDTVPAPSWSWMERNCGAYGFRTFLNVNNEPWHIQPVEIQTSRKWATVSPVVPVFNLPGQPSPKPLPDVPIPTLKIGSAGREVRQLINVLKFWRWYPRRFLDDTNDGKFGKRTEAGVKNMQNTLKVQSDGIYGLRTAKVLQLFLKTMQEI
jgi:hypothetical protein